MNKTISPKMVVVVLTAVLLLAAAVSAATMQSVERNPGHEVSSTDKQYCTSCHTEAQLHKLVKEKQGY